MAPVGDLVLGVGLSLSESQLWTEFSVFHQSLGPYINSEMGLGICLSVPDHSKMVISLNFLLLYENPKAGL